MHLAIGDAPTIVMSVAALALSGLSVWYTRRTTRKALARIQAVNAERARRLGVGHE